MQEPSSNTRIGNVPSKRQRDNETYEHIDSFFKPMGNGRLHDYINDGAAETKDNEQDAVGQNRTKVIPKDQANTARDRFNHEEAV